MGNLKSANVNLDARINHAPGKFKWFEQMTSKQERVVVLQAMWITSIMGESFRWWSS
jgi:hypothetical protein